MENICIVIVGNMGDYTSLKVNDFDFRNKYIVTTCIEVIQQCGVDNQDFISLWKYLDDEVIDAAERRTVELTEKFSISDDILQYLDVSYFDTTKIYMRYFFKAVYHTLYAFKNLFKEYKIEEILIRETKTQPINVAQYEHTHVLDGVAEFIAHRENIKITHFSPKPAILNTQVEVLRYNPEDFPFKEESFSENLHKPTILFLLSENFEWDFDLIHYLQRNRNLNIAVVWRTPPLNTQNELVAKDSPLFFSDFSFDDDTLENEYSRIESIRNSFKDHIQESQLPEEIFKNPFLQFQFNDLFNRLKVYVQDIRTFDRIFDFISPDAVYFSNSWDMSVRCMIQRAMKRGAETFTTQHGGIADNAGYITRQLEVDNYLVWGQDNVEGLIGAGQDPDSIKAVGSVQMKYWNNKIEKFYSEDKETEKEYTSFFENSLENINKERPFTITYFTSSGGGFSGHSIHEFHHLQTLRELAFLAERFPHIHFRIKPHILFDYDEFWKLYAVEKQIPSNFEIISKRDILKACLETDIGVLVNTISNVAYEIALAGKPVVFLKDACFNVECAESTLERGNVLCLHNVEDFEKFLKEYFDNELVKDDLEKRRIQFLGHSLEPLAPDVFKRIENLFLKVQKKSTSERMEDLYNTIQWVQHSFVTGTTGDFPKILQNSIYPHGKILLGWLYNLGTRRSLYYKGKNSSQYLFELVWKIPASFGITVLEKAKRILFILARKYYLQLDLHNNHYVRALLRK